MCCSRVLILEQNYLQITGQNNIFLTLFNYYIAIASFGGVGVVIKVYNESSDGFILWYRGWPLFSVIGLITEKRRDCAAFQATATGGTTDRNSLTSCEYDWTISRLGVRHFYKLQLSTHWPQSHQCCCLVCCPVNSILEAVQDGGGPAPGFHRGVRTPAGEFDTHPIAAPHQGHQPCLRCSPVMRAITKISVRCQKKLPTNTNFQVNRGESSFSLFHLEKLILFTLFFKICISININIIL